jgi:hypothetical protein
MASVWDDGQASSNNVLGQSDSWSGIVELSKEVGGSGTHRALCVERCCPLQHRAMTCRYEYLFRVSLLPRLIGFYMYLQHVK